VRRRCRWSRCHGHVSAFANDLLVGNFGDGRINVIDPVAGGCLGQLRDTTNKPITIPGLWA